MDLRPLIKSARQIEVARRLALRGLLSYQPYIFSDTFATGAGLSILTGHLKDPPAVYCSEGECTRIPSPTRENPAWTADTPSAAGRRARSCNPQLQAPSETGTFAVTLRGGRSACEKFKCSSELTRMGSPGIPMTVSPAPARSERECR